MGKGEARQEVGIQQELAKETMKKMVDVKRDFATEVVEEAIDGLVGRDGVALEKDILVGISWMRVWKGANKR